MLLIMFVSEFRPLLLNSILITLSLINCSNIVNAKSKPDFCSLKCAKGPNSACSDCKVGKNIEELAPNYEWRKAMLYAHNEYRNKIANGDDTRGGNKAASNILALSYDMDLEWVMGCYLSTKCMFIEDKCRLTPKYDQSVGQNLYETLATGMTEAKLMTEKGARDVVSSWYAGIKGMTADIINTFHPFDQEIEHFSQLIWATTASMGCSACERKRGGKKSFIVGCNYGPAGNIIGQSVYKMGQPASECPEGTGKNTMYKGLCGKIILPATAKTTGLLYKQKEYNETKSRSDSKIFLSIKNILLLLGVLYFIGL